MWFRGARRMILREGKDRRNDLNVPIRRLQEEPREICEHTTIVRAGRWLVLVLDGVPDFDELPEHSRSNHSHPLHDLQDTAGLVPNWQIAEAILLVQGPYAMVNRTL